jgi:hypothetical protein
MNVPPAGSPPAVPPPADVDAPPVTSLPLPPGGGTVYVPSLAPSLPPGSGAPSFSMRVPGVSGPVVVTAPPPGSRLEIPMPPTVLRWLAVHGIYLAVIVAASILFGLGKMDRGLFVAVISYVVGKYDERPSAEKVARILPDGTASP